MTETVPTWTGVSGTPGEHRTVGTWRSWCLTCQEWCYSGAPDMHCTCCDDTLDDPAVSIARSTLVRWAQYARDEVGLDALVEEIGAILGGYTSSD